MYYNIVNWHSNSYYKCINVFYKKMCQYIDNQQCNSILCSETKLQEKYVSL